MMRRERVSSAVMAALVCVAVVGLALSARMTMRMKKLSGDFRQEVSERFDLEAKIAGMEKQQAAAQGQIQDLTKQIRDSQAALDRTKAALEKEIQEKNALAQEMEKLRGAQAVPPSKGDVTQGRGAL